MTHLFEMKKKLAEMRALKNTLNAGVNGRSVAMTRGKIMNIYANMNMNFAACGYSKEAANVMNAAHKIIYR